MARKQVKDVRPFASVQFRYTTNKSPNSQQKLPKSDGINSIGADAMGDITKSASKLTEFVTFFAELRSLRQFHNSEMRMKTLRIEILRQ